MRCRWCGSRTRRVWCGNDCRKAHVATFGTARYDGPVRLTDGMGEMFDYVQLMFPGAWLESARLLAEALGMSGACSVVPLEDGPKAHGGDWVTSPDGEGWAA